MELRSFRRWIWNPYISATFRANYMIIGAQKSGTSALARLLARHPDVYLPRRKEIHFFDDRKLVESADYRLYHSYFYSYRGETMVGEATPSYMYIPYTAAALESYNPNLKLIMILRNPIERAFSHYNHNVRRNNESLPFIDALLKSTEQLGEYPHTQALQNETKPFRRSYKERGLYTAQIRNILLHFPREQILILRYEEFARDYLATLRYVYQFLALEYFYVDNIRANVFPYTTVMTTQAREYLLEYFVPQIDDLETLLGWDLSDWRH